MRGPGGQLEQGFDAVLTEPLERQPGFEMGRTWGRYLDQPRIARTQGRQRYDGP